MITRATRGAALAVVLCAAAGSPAAGAPKPPLDHEGRWITDAAAGRPRGSG